MKLSGVARKLSLAAGKNSAPRARKPQPRCNVDQAAEQKRHGYPLAPARSGCGQRALSASNSSPDVKTQPPGHPSRRFQSTEGQQKMAFPGSRLPPPPLPGGAGRDCPPARNCLRRLAPVGPGSTLPALKKQFFSLRQCPWSNVAALSGPYGRLAPSFSGRRTRLPGGRRRHGLRTRILPFFSHMKLSGGSQEKFQPAERQQKMALPGSRLPHHPFRRPPGGIDRRPETVRGA